jgi:hypothetical protein
VPMLLSAARINSSRNFARRSNALDIFYQILERRSK